MILISAVALFIVAAATLSARSGSNVSKIGKLSPLGCFDDQDVLSDTCAKHTLGLGAATALAISPDGRSVYVVSEGETLVRAKRDPGNGKLTPRGCIENTGAAVGCSDHADGLGGAGAVTVSPDGRSVYVAAEDGGISRFKRDRSSGKLTPKGCIDDNDSGGECSTATNGLEGATSVVVSADGRSVYASSEGDSAVVRFKRDRGSGKLTPKGCIGDIDTGVDICGQHTAGLGSPGALAISRDGKSLYASAEFGSLVRFKRDRSNGKLTPGGCVEDNDLVTTLGCGQSADGLEHPEAIAISRDGRSLYLAAGSGESALATFKRSAKHGKLTPKGCINDDGADACARSTNGMSEGAGLAVSDDGRSVYYASGQDDALVRFNRDRSSGKLTPKGCIDDNDTGTDPSQGEDQCASSTDAMAKLTGIVVSRDGKSVYATSEFDYAVTGFKRRNR